MTVRGQTNKQKSKYNSTHLHATYASSVDGVCVYRDTYLSGDLAAGAADAAADAAEDGDEVVRVALRTAGVGTETCTQGAG